MAKDGRVRDVGGGCSGRDRDVLTAVRGGGHAQSPAELLPALVPIEDAQAAVQIMRLSTVTRTTFLPRTLPPSSHTKPPRKTMPYWSWNQPHSLPERVREPASPDEVQTNPSLCRQQTVLGSEALCEAHFPVREGGPIFTSSAAIASAACIGCQALALARVLTAALTCGLSALLESLPERPLTTELITASRGVAEIATAAQLKDAVRASWTAIATGKEEEEKGLGELLSEVGSGAPYGAGVTMLWGPKSCLRRHQAQGPRAHGGAAQTRNRVTFC